MQTFENPHYPDPKIQPPESAKWASDRYPHYIGREEHFSLEQEYSDACDGGLALDIFQHVPTLRRFATNCDSVVEFGFSIGCSARGLLAARPKKLHCVDINYCAEEQNLSKVAEENNIEFKFTTNDSLKVDIGKVDLLHLDSNHSFKHVVQEFQIHSSNVSKYILGHDYGYADVRNAVEHFLSANKEWELIEVHTYNHGMYVLQRKGSK